mmetsp:Transcript_30643/g.95485  ORF Transcript_30643/g.95485 Transcript_30643/m.95485 type:complete len:243 (-) Transcript_30643:66-794(-)
MAQAGEDPDAIDHLGQARARQRPPHGLLGAQLGRQEAQPQRGPRVAAAGQVRPVDLREAEVVPVARPRGAGGARAADLRRSRPLLLLCDCSARAKLLRRALGRAGVEELQGVRVGGCVPPHRRDLLDHPGLELLVAAQEDRALAVLRGLRASVAQRSRGARGGAQVVEADDRRCPPARGHLQPCHLAVRRELLVGRGHGERAGLVRGEEHIQRVCPCHGGRALSHSACAGLGAHRGLIWARR